MDEGYDVIIVGAGIIGASIAFELSKRGHKTLNVDKLGAAGADSTANTCAIIRTHYSTLEGTAMAYESNLHWKELAARAQERDKLERLCRCVSRPPVAERRLSIAAHGNIRYRLKTPYRDGTHLSSHNRVFFRCAKTAPIA